MVPFIYSVKEDTIYRYSLYIYCKSVSTALIL